jgi:hypothetical protein
MVALVQWHFPRALAQWQIIIFKRRFPFFFKTSIYGLSDDMLPDKKPKF